MAEEGRVRLGRRWLRKDGDVSNQVSGEAGTVLQAGGVQGGIHVYQGRGGRWPKPSQLPLAPHGFVDREWAIDHLDGLSDPASPDPSGAQLRVSTLTGPPGVGKSALAIHWAHRVKDRFPDGTLFVDMQGYGPGSAVDPATALDGFLRAFGLQPEEIPVEPYQRASLFRSMVEGKRLLIVLDNVNSTGQVRPLIPATTRCFVLVTSRSKLAGLGAREAASRMNVDVLSTEESLRLLSELIGQDRVQRERSAATLLAELCGHLPLALRVVADRALDRPDCSLHDLADEVRNESSRLDALAVLDDELSDTRAVFSWSYHLLPEELRATFRALALHPGPTFDVRAVAVLADVDDVAARHRLRALVDVHLLIEEAPGRFKLHDLMRSYARERSLDEDSQTSRTEAVRRLQGWYLARLEATRQKVLPFAPSVALMPGVPDETVFGSAGEAMGWFAAERANVIAVLDDALARGHYDVGWKLPVLATGPLELGWYLSEWRHVHEVGRRAAVAAGDELGEALNEVLLGDAMWRQGDPQRASEHYRRALRSAEGLSEGWVAAFAARGLGLLEQERGDVVAARQHFESALVALRREGHRRGEALSLSSLAVCARMAGNVEDAISMGFEALEILDALADAWSVAWVRLSLSESLGMAERHDEAVVQLHLAAGTFRDIGDPKGEVLALTPLAAALEDRGDLAAAREALTRAGDLFERMNDPRADDMRRRADSLPGPDA